MDQYYIIEGIPPNDSRAEFYLRYYPNGGHDTLTLANVSPTAKNIQLKDIIQSHDCLKISEYSREDPDSLRAIVKNNFKIHDSIRIVEIPERTIFLPYEDKKAILETYFASIFDNDAYLALRKERNLDEIPKLADFPTTEAFTKACLDLVDLISYTYEESHLKIKVNAEVVNAFQFLWDFFKFRATPEN